MLAIKLDFESEKRYFGEYLGGSTSLVDPPKYSPKLAYTAEHPQREKGYFIWNFPRGLSEIEPSKSYSLQTCPHFYKAQ